MREHVTTDSTLVTTASASGAVTPLSPPGYDLLEEVGRGGMGVVYRARDTALGRDVAVKALTDRYAPGSPAAQRFLNEARITGQLQHPGIPPVHQVGVMSDGRPFLAMKLIKGYTLEQMLKDRSDPAADLGRLLAVFEAICQALGYAHAHQVIHRDLKPANVMVGAFSEVQVMDWGLAKVLGAETPPAGPAEVAAEQTRAWTEISPTPEPGSYTQAGSLVGTAAFVAPEQAAGELDKVNERADVFGLGAILAVVLTGKPPYVGESFESVRVLAVRGRLDDCFARLDACGAEPELVALCKRCLAFEPQDRPHDAGEVAQTVAGLRTAAEKRARSAERQQAAAAARAIEQRRRRRWQYAAASVVILALVGAILGLGVYLQAQAKANADLEAKNGELAAANDRERQRFKLAVEAIGLFTGDVSQDLLLKEKQFEKLRTKLLRAAADFYGKLEDVLKDQTDPKSRAALGKAYFELGELTGKIGNHAEALVVHRKALAVRRELAQRQGADIEEVLAVGRSLIAVGVALMETGDPAVALASYEEAREVTENLVATGKGSNEVRLTLSESLGYITFVLASRSRPAEGLEAARRALAIVQAMAEADPSGTQIQDALSHCHFAVGYSLAETGRLDEAIAMYLKSVAIKQKQADANPSVAKFQDELARQCNNIANALSRRGKLREAVAWLQRALAIWQKAADDNPAVTSLQNNLAFGLNGIAKLLIQTGHPTEALEALSKARPILQKLADADPSGFRSRRNLALNYTHTGEALLQMGKALEAITSFDKALFIGQRLAETFPNVSELQSGLAGSLTDFGWSLWKGGRPAEALARYSREKAAWQKLLDADPTNNSYRDRLANCETNSAAAFTAVGRLDEARMACERAVAVREALVKANPAVAENHQSLAESLLRFGQVRRASGDVARAATDWRRAGAIYASHPPEGGEVALFEACCHAALFGVAGAEGSGVSNAEGMAEAEKAMAIIRRAVANGYRDRDLMRIEAGLDPLRSRPDFQALLKEVALPAD